MYATVLQHPRKIATATIDAIAKYLSGETVPPQNLIPTALYRQSDAQKDPELK